MDVDSREFLLDPYPFYALKRAENPAFRRSDFEWTLTGYDIMSKFLANPAAGRGNIGQTPRPGGDTSELDQLKEENLALQILDQWMLFQNPPLHTRTRGRIADVFTLKVVNQLEDGIRTTINKLLDRVLANSERSVDFAQEIAYPYPLTTVCDLIGIPPEDRGNFFSWTRSFSLAVQVDFHRLDVSHKNEMNNSAKQVEAYFKDLIPRKKSAQDDDLMTRFINENEDDLDAQALLANCIFLLFAGQETTTSLLTNAMFALLTHPEQLALLKHNLELIPAAVEECLRYDPSIQMIGRRALADIDLGDILIKKDDHVFAFLGAAGRDPEANPNPNQFNLERENIKHLAFARGSHHCLGASMARMQIRILFEELLPRVSELSIAQTPTRRPTWLMRGLDSLPVHFKHA